jgi:hypothetical protein
VDDDAAALKDGAVRLELKLPRCAASNNYRCGAFIHARHTSFAMFIVLFFLLLWKGAALLALITSVGGIRTST